jgi:hypothetical protein
MLEEPAPLRMPVSFYTKEHLYTKANIYSLQHLDQEVQKPGKDFSLWLVRTAKHMPPLVVWDNSERITEATVDSCLLPLSKDDLRDLQRSVPDGIVSKIRDVGREWGCKLGRDSRLEEINPELHPFISRPVPRLKDSEYLKRKDWKGFIDSLVAFRTDEKDDRLKLVHRSRLFRGLDPFLNPHSIEATNGGTSKSTFYSCVGVNFDKVTASSFIGFAKSPKEVFPGTVDQMELPIGIDQMESQGADEICRYLFDLLDNGSATVSSGATRFPVTSKSIFAFLANATGYTVDTTKSFSSLIEHFSKNAAIARRFGILLYANDLTKIMKAPSEETRKAWRHAVQEFRAVEEFAWERLLEIVHSEEVWHWVNLPIDGYTKQVEDIASSLLDEKVKSFLREFCSGQRRTRGAALYAALADNLASIALEEYSVDKILEDAESYLGEYVQLNLSSVINIAKAWGQEDSVRLSSFYQNLSEILKEVVSAIELRKRRFPNETTFTLDYINYKPKSESYKGSFKECIRHLNRRENISGKLTKIRQNFGMDIVRNEENKEWKVVLLKTETPRDSPSRRVFRHFRQNRQFDTAFGDGKKLSVGKG